MMKRVIQIGLLLAVSGALTSAAAQARDGKTAYGALCRKCHGAVGAPAKAMAAKFPKLKAFDGDLTEEAVRKALTDGLSKDMPSFKGAAPQKLSEAEIAEVAKHVMTLKAK